MNNHPKSDWCSCTHVFEDEDPNYPPKAGTGSPAPVKVKEPKKEEVAEVKEVKESTEDTKEVTEPTDKVENIIPECNTAICPLCQHISWTGNEHRVAEVMNNHAKNEWCTCAHVFDDEDPNYPPKAGTGEPTPHKRAILS